jgi:hypothetical protein
VSLLVTITDQAAGTTESQTVEDGRYLLVLADPCEVTNSHQLADGSHLLTISGATARLSGPILV